MKIELKIQDRIILSNLMPKQNSFERLVLQNDIIEKIKWSHKELISVGFNNEMQTIDTAKDLAVEFEFSESEVLFVSNLLKDISAKNELSIEAIQLYKAFVN